MKRAASAIWEGSLQNGKGSISTESGALIRLPYSFAKRFGSESGTNPEELIGAAHASCFAMAFSAELSKQNLEASSIKVEAEVSIEKVASEWSISHVHLNVTAEVPGAEFQQINEAAEFARKNCPVSKLLKATVSMNLNSPFEENRIQ